MRPTISRLLAAASAVALGYAAFPLSAAAQTVTYPPGSDNSAPIVLMQANTNFSVASGTATQSGVISEVGGSRRITKVGSGELVLTADNTFTGSVTVSAGTLTLGDGGTTGSVLSSSFTVASAGTLVVNRSNAVTLQNLTLNSGLLRNIGAGLLTVSTNGGRIENFGTMELQGGTLTSTLSVLNNGLLTLNRPSVGGFTLTIAGTGDVRKIGAATNVLRNTTYTGATVISEGVLEYQGTIATSSINVAAGARVDFGYDGNQSASWGGTLTGAGGVRKLYTGTFTLTGTSTITGPTEVANGTLIVNGSLANSAVTLTGNGRLGGSGTVGNLTVISGSLVPSGLTVAGNLNLSSNTTYYARLSGVPGLRVTGAAALGGVVVVDRVTTPLRRIPILHADGAITGQFSGVGGVAFDGTTPRLVTEGHDVFVELSMSLLSSPNLTPNGRNMTRAMDDYFALTGAIPLAYLSLTAARVNEATGEIAPAVASLNRTSLFDFLTQVSERASSVRAGSAGDADASWSVWGTGRFRTDDTEGDARIGVSDRESNLTDFAFGADHDLGPNLRIGLAIAQSNGELEISTPLGESAETEGLRAGVYAEYDQGSAYASGVVAYSSDTGDTLRTLSTGEVFAGEAESSTFGGALEAGLRAGSPTTNATVYTSVQGGTTELSKYSERVTSGAGLLALSYPDQDINHARLEVGARFRAQFEAESVPIAFFAHTAVAKDDSDRDVTATITALPGAPFSVRTTDVGRSFTAGLGVQVDLQSGFTVTAQILGDWADNRTSGGAGLTARYVW